MVVSKGARLRQDLLTYAALFGFAAFSLFPFLWMIDTAFKPLHEVMTNDPTFLIGHPTLDNFARVLTHTFFLLYVRNSLVVASVSTIVAMIVSTFCAYALSRWGAMSRVRLVGAALLVSQAIPGVLLLVPLYILMQQLHLLNSYASLVLVNSTFTIPLCTFMLRGFFDSIPRELEDAAEMDGSTRLGFIWRVLMPLSVPGLVATAMFVFIAAWNEFMFGYVLINDDSRRTLTPGMMLFKGIHMTDWGGLMAASVMAVLPVALGFIYLQRFLLRGLAAGAVKG
jgi:ABC-type glycerol-3-phosphate transport system permease component